ncbi:MAG: PAS domain-containing protein [Shinella sp.]|uniref:PAS domain-containing protein n=1 Tax=Shinella sp. TaxID=1870904 RepID=UPI003C70D5B5
MQTRAATALFDYWTRQRGEHAVPLRATIEPVAIAAILPDVFILEYGRLQPPRFRLAGTRFCAQFGRELKGTDFAGLFAPDQRGRVVQIAQNVMAQAAPAILDIQLVDGTAETTDAEVVLLPMATSGNAADRIIGSFAPLPGQRQPLAAFRYATLTSLSVIDAERAGTLAGSRQPTPVPTSVMAMRPAGLGQAVSRVMHLRIFEGGRKGNDMQRHQDHWRDR